MIQMRLDVHLPSRVQTAVEEIDHLSLAVGQTVRQAVKRTSRRVDQTSQHGHPDGAVRSTNSLRHANPRPDDTTFWRRWAWMPKGRKDLLVCSAGVGERGDRGSAQRPGAAPCVCVGCR